MNPPPPDERLPQGWTKEFSKSQNRVYFYHVATKRSVWKLEDIGASAAGAVLAGASLAETPVLVPAAHEDVGRRAKLDHGASVSETVAAELGLERANFKSMVQSLLGGLLQDEDQTEVGFDPCSKDFRNIIHEAALDLGLLSFSRETELGKFVVCYKKGFEPDAEAEAQGQLAAAQPVVAPRKKKRQAALQPPPITCELEVLGTVKRDRRTIEQLEAEIKRAKTAAAAGGRQSGT